MAGHGPAPKGERARERDTPETTTLTEPDEDVLFGKPLPAGVLPKDQQWHPQTLALWDSLRRNPLLAAEPELGWQFLIDTALMHHTMWTAGKWEFASEVRLRVAKFGATPEDRMRLKLKIEVPAAVAPKSPQVRAAVTNIESRRSRLGQTG